MWPRCRCYKKNGAALTRCCGNLAKTALKRCQWKHAGLRPADEANFTVVREISMAVDDGLMLQAHPGVFVAGENCWIGSAYWRYLTFGPCLATGAWAGHHAAAWAHRD